RALLVGIVVLLSLRRKPNQEETSTETISAAALDAAEASNPGKQELDRLLELGQDALRDRPPDRSITTETLISMIIGFVLLAAGLFIGLNVLDVSAPPVPP